MAATNNMDLCTTDNLERPIYVRSSFFLLVAAFFLSINSGLLHPFTHPILPQAVIIPYILQQFEFEAHTIFLNTFILILEWEAVPL